jgi:hypothetical protein
MLNNNTHAHNPNDISFGVKGLAHKKNGNTTQKSGNTTQKKSQ